MKRTLMVGLGLMMALTLASCGLAGGGTELEGTSWVLATMEGKPPIAGRAPSLRFEDGSVGGNSSCNSFGGEYHLRGSQISFGDLFWTLMACPEGGVMEQEQAYMQQLGEVDQYQIRDGRLILTGPGGTELVFVQAE